jgi:methionyl-tRNA formyltransferase
MNQKKHTGKLRILLCGQKWIGAQVFKALYHSEDTEIVAVSSPDGTDEHPDRLTRQAELYGIDRITAGTLTAMNVPEGTDLIVCAHSHDFIGEKTRMRATYGGIGYHPSLLPLHRGKDAIRWAIKMGDRITGGTVYRLSNQVDGGEILDQAWCFIRPKDDAKELWRRDLGPMGVELLTRTVERIAQQGHMYGQEQDEALATWEPSMDAPPVHRPDLIMLGHDPAA